MKVLLIDNFNLFTHNVVDEFAKKYCQITSYRNDIDIQIIYVAVKKFKPNLIVISSGPGNVSNSGNSVDVIRNYAGKIPIFGIGLGHQCIIKAFGGKIEKTIASHAKTSQIKHDEKSIFKKMKNPFSAGMYNSLSASDVPYSLEVSARDENDHVVAVRHKECFVEGIQFHPESILTPDGGLLIDNVIKEATRK